MGGCNGAEERSRWRSDASEEEKAHTCSMAPLGICMSAWSRDCIRETRGAVEVERRMMSHMLTLPLRDRYEKEFEGVQDVFELQRNLNNAFAYDLVPSPSVVIAALRAARRVNDFPTAVRIFEGTFLLALSPVAGNTATAHTGTNTNTAA